MSTIQTPQIKIGHVFKAFCDIPYIARNEENYGEIDGEVIKIEDNKITLVGLMGHEYIIDEDIFREFNKFQSWKTQQ